ncbi:hypothetical protein AAFC00_002612 [Neodothiora populina]|uniref:RanBD1 domain-containing protein n=1 Tax=Neodothiora populina TaxID=2781224 RepID=A0ABR3P912_9PEZI
MSSSPRAASDTENHEKPVREKLRNASISAASTLNTMAESTSETAAAPAIVDDDARDSAQPGTTPAADMTTSAPNDSSSAPSTDTKTRGRPSRKRSHEDIADESQEEPAPKTRHARKRSREAYDSDEPDHSQERTSLASGDNAAARSSSTANKRPATPADDEDASSLADKVASPRTKKSRPDEPVNGSEESAPASEGQTEDAKPTPADSTESSSFTKIPPTSGFANPSTASPFTALASNKSPTNGTTPSAFESSSFARLASSSTSGFASLAGNAPKLSSFASASPTPPPATAADSGKSEHDKPAAQTFGGALGASSPFTAAAIQGATPSPFGSAGASSFGQAGKTGFGSGLAGGFGGLGSSKLSSFASSATPAFAGSGALKAAKPFGAPADDGEGDEGPGGDAEEGGAGDEPKNDADNDEKDERFYEQDIETGEENETTEYTCRAKLYNFVKTEDGTKKEWKERGLGVVRLNVANPGPESGDTAPKARLVMRADGSHRVVLNTPVVKGVSFGTVQGEAPVGGYVYFMGSIDGSAKLELLQMKLRPQFALELYERIADLQKAM